MSTGVGRLANVPPCVREIYYLRILLTVIKDPTCFNDIKMVRGVVYPTFRDACCVLGLIDDANEYGDTIVEFGISSSESVLRNFVGLVLDDTDKNTYRAC